MPPKTRGKQAAKTDTPAVPDSTLFDSLVITLSAYAAKDRRASQALSYINACGGKVVASVTKALTHLVVVPDDVLKQSAKLKTAKGRTDVSVVSLDYFVCSAQQGKILNTEDFKVDADERDEDDEQEDEDEAEEEKPTNGKKTKTEAGSKRKRETEDDEDAVPEEPAKMVKFIKKGNAVVDEVCPVARTCHVYEDESGVYDCMLNQTEIKNNNNKFYVIQVLEDDANKSYYLWNRWGRVGATGQDKLEQISLDRAIAGFKGKFRDKTKNDWDDRAEFVKHPGKYFLLERDYGDDLEDNKESKASEDGDAVKEEVKVPDSKLPSRVQDLISLIFNVEMMTQSMVEIGYDAKKLPLGKLTKTNIKKGYNALAAISDELAKPKPSRDVLIELSSLFYTIIPHVFPNTTRPTVINTPQLLKSKLEMVEALGDIEVATEILKSTKNLLDSNPIDNHYKSLNTGLKPIDRESPTFTLIEKYMKNTHAATHNSYSLEIEDIFDVAREDEADRCKSLHNKQLLWHGSRLTNFVGILSQGLKIAPPEAPVTGYMFGKGIYFANMVSKSANYCCTSRSSPTGILLLCEVELGDTHKLTNADYHAGEGAEAAGCHSTHGQGQTTPDPKDYTALPDEPDVNVPCGKGVPSKVPGAYLQYDEFIVYKVQQAKIRYLIRTRFKHKY
ncbi:poly polymerase catalytic domain-containing protein [Fimicolochytrium jonesii]|uniref:poly polymerase catalytic domain-containing protein n=1 Tax=Fimicolochytrium jonesii TaxID=1396493 RepID=UPI0022FE7023|nr:poly polymerase catalytic domain-containing protein [Fimicolochytrium jonesii]KAI8821830.1 poly polymerase catalytic domain-containing protein [Fimicolochytrium jonesii]